MNKQEIYLFREWFKRNQSDFEEHPDRYIDGVLRDFGLKCTSLPRKDSRWNSGIKENINASLEDIKKHIDELVDNALIVYEKNSNSRKIIDQYGDETHRIEENFPDKNCDEYRVLDNWHKRKRELKSRITDYFQIKFNRD